MAVPVVCIKKENLQRSRNMLMMNESRRSSIKDQIILEYVSRGRCSHKKSADYNIFGGLQANDFFFELSSSNYLKCIFNRDSLISHWIILTSQ